jgi:hypothetical protein
VSFVGLIIAVLAAWMSWRAWRESQRQAVARRHLLDAAHGVLSEVSETPLPSGYVRVAGAYRGQPVLLEPVVDMLAVRKLPALWLMVTVAAPTAAGGTFDLMMRATGAEVFSRYHDLPHGIEVPAGFPEWAGIRTDTPERLPPMDVVGHYLQRFVDGTGKELLITPKGLRMVVLVDEGDRGGYLIFREARFGTRPVSADVVRAILDDLLALREDLVKHAGHVRAAS